MAKTKKFENRIFEYEQWFINNAFAFKSELMDIERLIPSKGRGIEVDIESGFASSLGIIEGCDPSAKMRAKAMGHGLEAKEVTNILQQHSFSITQTLHTLVGNLSEIKSTQLPIEDYGIGSFVVIRDTKI